MSRILLVGTCVLDLIFDLRAFPGEDSVQRAQGFEQACGGNASNSAQVLRQLGHAPSLATNLGCDIAADWLQDALRRRGVDTRFVHRAGTASSPISSIWRCRDGASRTIVHHRDRVDFAARQFEQLPLAGFDWLHFEGRNADQLALMIASARRRRPECRISLEAEKNRVGLAQLLHLADVVMLSRDWARQRGHEDTDATLREAAMLAPRALLTCTWGADGAALCAPGAIPQHLRAPALAPIVDSIGAGDTFNAALIDALLRGLAPQAALAEAIRLATRKCGGRGLDALQADFERRLD